MGVLSLYIHYFKIITTSYNYMTSCIIGVLKYISYMLHITFSKYDCIIVHKQGRPQDLGGGGQEFFFFRFGNLHVAKRHAAHGEVMRIARGVRGHAPTRNFFKTMQFGAF